MGWTIAIAGLIALLGGGVLAFVLLRRWYDRETEGVAYFGRPLEERRAFRAELARRGRWLVPLFRLAARVPGVRRLPSVRLDGVTGPGQACTVESYRRTRDYRPLEGDIFVATQMKCGTTWMQQVVYEVLSRGKGDLGDGGHRHLYALSPWIESRHSVSLEDAPRVGERRARIIKTHMPTRLCPYGEAARYLYVTRHPVACFASCVDFIRMLSGPLAPRLPALLDWYCSDDMWWLSWPEHVEGWWRWAQERPNVLFVHYETMLDDLPGVVRQVADFLGAPLSEEETKLVVQKSSFDFMKRHEEVFEMSVPTPFSAGGAFLVSGSRDRERDVGEAERARILAFCRERLDGARYPVGRFYPDVIG